MREFVESAYKIDPRVSKRKDAQKQARLVSRTAEDCLMVSFSSYPIHLILISRIQKKQEKIEARRRVEEEERIVAERQEVERKAKEEAERELAREEKRQKDETRRALESAKETLVELCTKGIH